MIINIVMRDGNEKILKGLDMKIKNNQIAKRVCLSHVFGETELMLIVDSNYITNIYLRLCVKLFKLKYRKEIISVYVYED